MIQQLVSRVVRAGVHAGYRVVRPVIFCFDSETVHEWAIATGEYFGKVPALRWIIGRALIFSSPILSQNIAGIEFVNPIGLAAGFDYEARLAQITKSIGFSWSTVGTVTNLPYEGNKKPRLGRLVRSRSLVVNKGFKNLGIDATLARLAGVTFPIPVGMSIGKTNNRDHTTQEQGIEDIVSAFKKVETTTAAAGAMSFGTVPFSYYELNISCPNLHGPIEFYSPAHLTELLDAVFSLQLSHPIFIKMPIVKTNEETLAILATVAHFPVKGVIIGNLSGDRTDPLLVQKELEQYPKGGLSGLATQARSDELITLAYKNFGSRFITVGCGGVFTAEDAYRKIRAGASLIQMITGMIFEGPQLPASINAGLATLLKKDGFKNIKDAVGVDVSVVK